MPDVAVRREAAVGVAHVGPTGRRGDVSALNDRRGTYVDLAPVERGHAVDRPGNRGIVVTPAIVSTPPIVRISAYFELANVPPVMLYVVYVGLALR